MRGSTTLTSDKVFNQTTLEGGTRLDSEPEWVEVRFTYLRRVTGETRGKSSVWLLLGVDYHYINWNFGATIAPGSIREEPSEDFYAQTFPLPVLGLRYSTQLSPTSSLELRGDGFRASHWRHWNDEGGPIHTSSTISMRSGLCTGADTAIGSVSSATDSTTTRWTRPDRGRKSPPGEDARSTRTHRILVLTSKSADTKHASETRSFKLPQ